jgi:hypothetical protein
MKGDKAMKLLDTLFHVFAVLGVFLIFYALIGRFIKAPTVLGDLIPGGMSATSAILGANTFLLLSIVAYLFKKESENQE